MLRRVKLNKKQAELVNEMTQAYAAIIASCRNTDNTMITAWIKGERISEIKSELGIPGPL